mgnify:FL=1
MTLEERDRLHEELNILSKNTNLSVDEMESIDRIRSLADSADESAGEEKAWEEKYKKLEEDYRNIAEENSRITDAYRRRWDESTVGTKVNGEFVDKTVTDVSYNTYEDLLTGGEK